MGLRLPVERQVHCDLVAESGDGARQGSDYVGKSSGFGKRNTLGCGKQDVHRASAKHEQSWMRGGLSMEQGAETAQA